MRKRAMRRRVMRRKALAESDMSSCFEQQTCHCLVFAVSTLLS
jgi:hypothetical protein